MSHRRETAQCPANMEPLKDETREEATMRCAIYARYSSEKQNPRSIDAQVKKCREYAQERGWTILEDHIYMDEAISGAQKARPGYQRLMRVIGRNRQQPVLDAVIVEDASRTWRDIEEQARALKVMKFNKVALKCCDGSDSESQSATLLLGVKGLMNDEALKEIGVRTIRGLRDTAEQGLHTGGRCFGYKNVRLDKAPSDHSKKNPTKLVVDPEEAAIVRRIFEMYAGGYSYRKIAKTLNAEGVQSARPQTGRLQRSWSISSIQVMLRNERYHGVVIFGKSKREKHPETDKRLRFDGDSTKAIRREFPEQRIISESLWSKVATRLAEKLRAYNGTNKGGLTSIGRSLGNPYLFSGLLKCSECGANITLISGRGKNHAEPFYGCPMNFNRGTCSNDVKIRKDALEKQLLAMIQSEVLHEDRVKHAVTSLEKELKSGARNAGDQAARLADKRKKLEAELKNLTKAVATGLDSPTIRGEIVEREQGIRAIDRQLRAAKPESVSTDIRHIRKFIESEFHDYRAVLNGDPVSAKAMLARHMPQITLKPVQNPDGCKVYEVTSRWELLNGGQDQAQMRCAEGQS